MITSTSNLRIVAARKLRRRAGRDDASAFLVEGARAVTAALDAAAPVEELFIDPSGAGSDAVAAAARRAGMEPTPVSPGVVNALSDAASPQGAVAVVRMPESSLHGLDPAADLVMVLAGVGDPGNAGTLIRSAVATGAAAVVFAPGSVDPFNPKTVRAAAGSLWATVLVRDVPMGEAAATLAARGFSLVGTAADARRPHYDADLTGKIAVVVGNEAWGLPDEARAACDEVVAIPMRGPAESLNAGVAGSILLFEVLRQRAAWGAPPDGGRPAGAVYPRPPDA